MRLKIIQVFKKLTTNKGLRGNRIMYMISILFQIIVLPLSLMFRWLYLKNAVQGMGMTYSLILILVSALILFNVSTIIHRNEKSPKHSR